MNLSVLAAQLARLADARASSERADAPPIGPGGLFDLHGELPALSFRGMRVTARGADTLTGSIPALARVAPPHAHALASALASALDAFDHAVREHAERADASPDGPAGIAFARRYCLLAAGAACLGLLCGGTADAVLPAVLARILSRLGAGPGLGEAETETLLRALDSACATRELLSIVPLLG